MLNARKCCRRDSERVDVDLRVISVDTKECGSKIKNISESGLFLETENILHIGKKVIIKFKLPGRANPLTCYCRVVWHKFVYDYFDNVVNGYGVQFLRFNDFQSAKFSSYVSEQQ